MKQNWKERIEYPDKDDDLQNYLLKKNYTKDTVTEALSYYRKLPEITFLQKFFPESDRLKNLINEDKIRKLLGGKLVFSQHKSTNYNRQRIDLWEYVSDPGIGKSDKVGGKNALIIYPKEDHNGAYDITSNNINTLNF